MSIFTKSTDRKLIGKTTLFMLFVLFSVSNIHAAKLLYIYSATNKTDSTQAVDYKTLLSSFGHTVTLINVNQVKTTQLSQFDLIVVSSGTSVNNFHWEGDTTCVRLIKESGKCMLSLGKGGSLLFGDMQLWCNWGNSASGSRNTVKMKAAFSSMMSSPNNMMMPQDSMMMLCNSSNIEVELYLGRGIPADVTILALSTSNANYAPMAFEKNKYFFWGFGMPATDLSMTGKNLLQNVITYVLKANGVTAVKEPTDANVIPSEFKIDQNYPNPFNPSTNIRYQLPSNSFVTIKVYDILGKEVATLVRGNESAGTHNVNFDASKLTSGVYIYTLNAGSFVQSKKMMLLK